MMEANQQAAYTHLIPQEASAQRVLDYVLEHLDWITTRNGIKKALKRGEFYINGEVIEASRIAQPGQELSYLPKQTSRPVFELSIPVIYEDDDLAIINKPAGYGVSGNYFRTIQNALAYNLKSSTKADSLLNPMPVHRLDNPTAGLLIIAKTKTAHVLLGKMLESKAVEKKYKAIVVGRVEDSGIIDAAIDGKPASTVYKCLKRIKSKHFGVLSLMELAPLTGRTHQLRIHMANNGTPILSDKQYGNTGSQLKGKGLFLFACGLNFKHPIGGTQIQFYLPLPNKFKKLIPFQD